MGELATLAAYACAFAALADFARHGVVWSSVALVLMTPVVAMLPEARGPDYDP